MRFFGIYIGQTVFTKRFFGLFDFFYPGVLRIVRRGRMECAVSRNRPSKACCEIILYGIGVFCAICFFLLFFLQFLLVRCTIPMYFKRRYSKQEAPFMKKVLIPTKLDKVVKEILTARGFTVVQDKDTPLADLAKANPDTESMIIRSEKIPAEIMDLMPSLKLIVRAGAGYDNVDTKYARRKNIDVMNTPGANSNAVAEEVVAMILAAYRKLIPADISTRAGKWEKGKLMGHELTGKTLGIIGLGHIGRLLVKRTSGFEVNVLGFDPVLSQELAQELGVKLCTVEEIFANADIISLHIPENDATRGLVNDKLLSLIKPGTMIVNCARAGIVDEEALRKAKAEKGLIYCNDVYKKDIEGEKSIADVADIMAPHIGANTFEANFVAAKRAAEQTVAYFENGVTTCVVNKGVPDGLNAEYQHLASLLAKLARICQGPEVAVRRVETSFYGNLHHFAKWMTSPICAGLSPDFDPYLDSKDAMNFLASRGVELLNREVDDAKNYGESITIDLIDDKGACVSVRGTITEGKMMISRINGFDRLYLEPAGNNLFFEYKDASGVIAKLSGTLSLMGINIIDIRAPQNTQTGNSLAAIKTDSEVPCEAVAKMAKLINAVKAFKFNA